MRRDEAMNLIGQQVRAWTAANGEYVGTLLGVSGRPWRGQVRITGITAPAQHFERGRLCRRGFRVGETIQVGHSSIGPCQHPGSDSYLEVLTREQVKLEGYLANNPNPKDLWWLQGGIKALAAVRLAEERRLLTGLWKLEPVESIA